jgi:hypothetical protein
MYLIVNSNAMTDERKTILDRVNALIEKRKDELLKALPSIHEIDDGIIIRFFTNWDNCDSNELIRYKRIIDDNKPNDVVIFYFIPKGAIIERKKRDYIHCISCISGKVELNINNKIECLTGFKKICFDAEEFEGVALEDTYVLTSNR